MFCLASGEVGWVKSVGARCLRARESGRERASSRCLARPRRRRFGAASITDLANVRLVCVAKRIAINWDTQWVNTPAAVADSNAADLIRAVRVQEQGHYKTLAPLLGATAPSDDDYTFTFPKGALRSPQAAAALRRRPGVDDGRPRRRRCGTDGRSRHLGVAREHRRRRRSAPQRTLRSRGRDARSWTGSRPRSASKTPETSLPRSSRIRWYP